MKGWVTLRRYGVMLITVLLLGVLVACNTTTPGIGDVGEGDNAVGEPVTGVEEVGLDDIADDPDEYIGQTVTVSGEVSEVLAPQVFRINEDNLLDIGDELLVVHTGQQTTANLAEDSEIQVTGVVHRFTVGEVENTLGIELGLDDDLEVEYENRPAIVATGIDVLEMD